MKLTDEQIANAYHAATGQTLRKQDQQLALQFARLVESIATSGAEADLAAARKLLRESLRATYQPADLRRRIDAALAVEGKQ